MSDVFELRTSDGTVLDFLDKTKFKGFKFMDPPTATRERNITSYGCGNVPGRSAMLNRSRLVYITRTYEFDISNLTYQDSKDIRDSLEDAISGARAWNLDLGRRGGAQAWIVRLLQNQIIPTVWTILDGWVYDIKEENIALGLDTTAFAAPIIVLKVDFDLMQGAEHVDDFGFPYTGVSGGTSIVFPTFPSPPTPLVSSTTLVSPTFR